MQSNLPVVLPLIRQSEGMEVNRDPGEPGGISKGGVSLTALADFRKGQGLPAPTADDVANLTAADVDAFYSAAFLPRIRFNDLPTGIDYALADAEVNSGQTGAVWIVELALGIWPLANAMTDDLLAKIKAANPRDLIVAIRAVWIGEKKMSPKWDKDGHGWTNRNNRVLAQSLAMIGA